MSEREEAIEAVLAENKYGPRDAMRGFYGYNVLGMATDLVTLRERLTTAERERDEARRERDGARDAVRLALTELDWQMEAQSRCAEYGAECPLQDAGKWNSEHMEARVACRRALVNADSGEAAS